MRKYTQRKLYKAMSLRTLMAITLAGALGMSLIGAAVYLISGQMSSFSAAFFESVSTLTTTGTSLFESPAQLPVWVKIFRAGCQWIGGAATLTLFACLFGDSDVFSTGEDAIYHTGIRFVTMIKRLLSTYAVLTIAEIGLLIATGCSAVNAVCLAFSTMSTGGIATGESIPAASEVVIVVFMILTIVNYTLYYHAIKGHREKYEKNTELSALVWILAASCVIVSASLFLGGTYDIKESVHYGFFQAVSNLSTTGFTLTNISNWPAFTRAFLSVISFIGGSSMSAASGIKIIRIVVIFRILSRSFTVRIHPKAVVSTTINGKQVPRTIASGMSSYFITYMVIYLMGVFVISFESPDFASCFTVPAALINNLGIWASGNIVLANLSPVTHLLLSLLMLAGRLELYAVFLPFSRKN